jgi:hypothetical protein
MKMNVRELFKVVIGGLALRGAWATGLSVPSLPRASSGPASQRHFGVSMHNFLLAVFPLLSLAEVLRISFHGFTQSTTRTYHFRIKHMTKFMA